MDVLESQLRLGRYCDHLLRNTEAAELQKNTSENWKVACLQLRINGRLCAIPVAQIANMAIVRGPLEQHQSHYGCWQQPQKPLIQDDCLSPPLLDVSALAVCGLPNARFEKASWEGLVIGLKGHTFALLADHNVGIVQLFSDDFKVPKDSGHDFNFPWMTRILPYGNNPLWANSVWLLNSAKLVSYIIQQDSDKREQAALLKQQRPVIGKGEVNVSLDDQPANRAAAASQDTIKPEAAYMAISEALALARGQSSSK
jgi:hypothetical protein